MAPQSNKKSKNITLFFGIGLVIVWSLVAIFLIGLFDLSFLPKSLQPFVEMLPAIIGITCIMIAFTNELQFPLYLRLITIILFTSISSYILYWILVVITIAIFGLKF